jgi:hypothetical protein
MQPPAEQQRMRTAPRISRPPSAAGSQRKQWYTWQAGRGLQQQQQAEGQQGSRTRKQGSFSLYMKEKEHEGKYN